MTRKIKHSISGLVMVLMAVLFGACASPSANPTSDGWMEDAVPGGATQLTSGVDVWNFVNSNPTPFSGSLALKSALIAGDHSHWFQGATTTLQINKGDVLYCYVYLDPTNPPSEIMLQWNTTAEAAGVFGKRAYWGANSIDVGTDGTPSRRFIGPLPPTGQWVKLEVPASLVDLEGFELNGMLFRLFDGQCAFDQVGKTPGPQRAQSLITVPPLQIPDDRRTEPVDARRRALSVVVPITESFFQS